MTARQKVTLQPAYLLHHYDYRDSSKLYELITRDYGRVGLVGRGVRSSRSRFRGLLQPFRPLIVSWSGRGDLGTLTAAEAASSTIGIPAHRINCGYYLNELLLRLTRRHHVLQELFGHYSTVLQALGEDAAEARCLRIFEKRLLETLGYGLELSRTISDEPVSAQHFYQYRLEQGLVRRQSGDSRDAYSGLSLLSLEAEQLQDEQSLRDAQRLLGAVLEVYLGPRPLKVRAVNLAMRRGTQ